MTRVLQDLAGTPRNRARASWGLTLAGTWKRTHVVKFHRLLGKKKTDKRTFIGPECESAASQQRNRTHSALT